MDAQLEAEMERLLRKYAGGRIPPLDGMDAQLEAEMERLLRKYAGGRIPPLADMTDHQAGLINGELIEIYQRGFLSRHAVRLGILLAARRATTAEERWSRGDYRLNELARTNWARFCASLRESPVGEQACEKCDKRRAILAEERGEAIAYLCDNGMIDFAVPVFVMGRPAAVLFSGQYKPKPGPIWNPEIVWPNGCFRPLASGETGVDAWEESKRRIAEIERRAGFQSGSLLRIVDTANDGPVADAVAEIAPEEIERVRALMQKAGQHLSHLATSTLELEKSKLIGWIRGRLARSLASLGAVSADTKAVWRELAIGLGFMARYYRVDYAWILGCRHDTREEMVTLCQYGLPETEFPLGGVRPITRTALAGLRRALCNRGEWISVALNDHTDAPGFAWLCQRHAREKSKRVLAIPLIAPAEPTPPVMIMGRYDKDMNFDACLPADRDALSTFISDISLVAEIVLLVERLRETARRQALFVEDVAHDLRNPIQNIILEADVLARGLVAGDQVAQVARKMAAQARRLHLMSQRLWTLQNIDRGSFSPQEVEPVAIYPLVMDCRKLLLDLAAKRGIEIKVDPALQSWPQVRVNKGLFGQAILNLIDNAIKYSRPDTEIRIEGWRTTEGVVLTFGNRGFPIREADKDRIFERYFRTPEAKTHVQEGSGIGLYIVKVFADHYGNIEVESSPIPGTRDYLTVFKLFIRERGS